jgi:hypothetical protein
LRQEHNKSLQNVHVTAIVYELMPYFEVERTNSTVLELLCRRPALEENQKRVSIRKTEKATVFNVTEG